MCYILILSGAIVVLLIVAPYVILITLLFYEFYTVNHVALHCRECSFSDLFLSRISSVFYYNEM